MRSLFLVVIVVGVAGCSVVSLFDEQLKCTDDSACPDTAPHCVEFQCSPVDPGGEGEGEGEGDGGEGEGEGEGEEGEGDAGEGEGEGEEGEGEGEGEGDVFAGCDHVVISGADDEGDVCDDVRCSLRGALDRADAADGHSVVCLAVDVVVDSAIAVVNGDVTVEGFGHGVVGAGDDRLFVVDDTQLELRQLALSRGHIHNEDGGAIRALNDSALILDEVQVHDNNVEIDIDLPCEGGAIAADALVEVVVRRSVFTNNRVDRDPGFGFARGGAIALFGAALDVSDSFFVGNFATDVGGVFYVESDLDNVVVRRDAFFENGASFGGVVDINCAASGTLLVENSTFVANGQDVVFVCGDEALLLSHCSFDENAGALVQLGNNDDAATPSRVRLRDNAITHEGPLCTAPNGGVGSSEGGNVSTTTADAVCALQAPTDVDGDPDFGVFGDHGGPTPTLPLPPQSPARNAALDGRCPAVDQRGVPRSRCDAGAVEGN